jgi:hypothetical protein
MGSCFERQAVFFFYLDVFWRRKISPSQRKESVRFMKDTVKKILKICGIISAIAVAAIGAYFLITKVLKKKTQDDAEIESFVTCSCIENDPIQVDEGADNSDSAANAPAEQAGETE